MVSGGLFMGPRRAPLRSMPHVAQANERITQLTGARFGDGYRRLVEDGSFVMDSGAAAGGFAALRAEASAHAMLGLAGAMQQAFNVDGLSLSDPETYLQVALAHQLDGATVVARLATAATQTAAQADFERSPQPRGQLVPDPARADHHRHRSARRTDEHRRPARGRIRAAPGPPPGCVPDPASRSSHRPTHDS